jgi:predicted metal-dependent hydrolase
MKKNQSTHSILKKYLLKSLKSYVAKTGRPAPMRSIKKMYKAHAYCSSIQH